MTEPQSLRIEKSGPQCLMVDLGSLRVQHLGIAQGGAVDEHGFLWANKLLHNHATRPALEFAFGPSQLSFQHATRIAITGAARSFKLNGKERKTWQSCDVNAGDLVQIDAPRQGVRTYLAVIGGFAPHNTLAAIKGQQRVYFEHDEASLKRFPAAITPQKFVPDYSDTASLGVIVADEQKAFTHQSINDFFDQSHEVSAASNRMAYLLEACQPLQVKHENFYSQALPLGAIQIPPSGKAIVLLKDRQTIGGYPLLGYLTHLDCFRLSQVRPGQQIRFYRQEAAQARSKLIEFYRFFL